MPEEWPAAPMVAFSLPSLSSVACTNGMPKAEREAPTAACSRSGWKVLNMNSTLLAALRCRLESIACA